jgi:predicted permease
MKPGLGPADVQQDLQAAFQSAALEAWRSKKGTAGPSDVPRLEVVAGSQGLTGQRSRLTSTMAVLGAIVGTVLLLICVNIASLMLARAERRRAEMAVRMSIGAGRGRLIRQLLVESVVMTSTGAVLGVLFAYWGRDIFDALITRANPDFVIASRMDLGVLALTIGVSWLAGVLIGLAPGLRATRVDPHPSLKDTISTRRPHAAAGPALLVTQVALSLILVVTAGLFVRTLRNLQKVDVGFDADRLVLFRAAPPPAVGRVEASATARVLASYDELSSRLLAIPGVERAAYSYNSLLGGDLAMPFLVVPGQPRAADEDRTVYTQDVSPAFFDTMGMPVVLGRAFTRDDVTRSVAVVNETLARRFFPDGTAVGRRIGMSKGAGTEQVPDAELLEIVGVMGDAKYMTLRESTPPAVFRPVRSAGPGMFAVRVAGDPLAIAGPIRDLGRQLNPQVYVNDFRTQRQQIEQTLAREHEFAFLSTLFGLLALSLTSIGLYGLLSYTVARRTQEIGLRMALGARQWHVVRSVLRQTMTLVAIGLAMGLTAALMLSRFIRSQLFGVGVADPLTIAAAVVLMCVVALVASALPARRAVRVDPLVALRVE